MFHDILKTDRPGDVLASRALANASAQPGTTPGRRRHASFDRASPAAVLQALDLVPEAVLFLNADLRIVDVNAAAARVSGYRRGALPGMRLEEIISDDGDGRLRAALERSLLGETASDAIPARQHTQDGIARPVLVQLHFVDQDAESRLVAIVREPTDPRDAERRRESASERDYLTSLPARAALEARLRWAERRARQRRSRFAILFIDIDRFKNINDANGHRVGDLVLQTLSQRLLSSVRPGDFVARYGGDEFVALIEDVRGKAEVERIAARIRVELTAPIHVLGGQLQISASVGIAVGHATSSAQALVDEADLAMYRVKQAKRTKDLANEGR